ncbi:hormogonium polysaccharide secretion pseudopilin HpsC [Chroococcidiopsis sp. CCMEE 29]|uniref:hormogonium polysaccharide secretion pseudopilin HpsC n=1 Tax=Chroococcidiopsis sp. CCMEE 29 TaxID=155894 RepID=UPI00202183F3|nr:hormogonium polysaccharide secretion pseudopilin HpsC [Chroococcidiopsis sp. CCMEE 29]
MIDSLKWLLNIQRKRSRLTQVASGFTLVELLVAMMISTIVITTLLTFVTNMIDTERREQAKATTEQEVQAALDYIADDLQEAVYIYDADGINAIKSQLPNPGAKDRVPVLVFWKRLFLPKDSEVTLSKGNSTKVGCLAKIPGTNTCNERDYFVYSLVAYYLIKNNNSKDSIWSSTARIGRFEVQDGISNPNIPNSYLKDKDPGFKLFDLSLPGNIKDKMNAWTKDSSNYDLRKNKIETLVDYIDQSKESGVPTPVNCEITTSAEAQQVPENDANPLGIYSFYACVDSSRNLAQVYLRGNALARIHQNAMYSNDQSVYFPTVNVQVQSWGTIN